MIEATFTSSPAFIDSLYVQRARLKYALSDQLQMAGPHSVLLKTQPIGPKDDLGKVRWTLKVEVPFSDMPAAQACQLAKDLTDLVTELLGGAAGLVWVVSRIMGVAVSHPSLLAA